MARARSSFKLPVNHINDNLHAGILNSLSLLPSRRDGLCRCNIIPGSPAYFRLNLKFLFIRKRMTLPTLDEKCVENFYWFLFERIAFFRIQMHSNFSHLYSSIKCIAIIIRLKNSSIFSTFFSRSKKKMKIRTFEINLKKNMYSIIFTIYFSYFYNFYLFTFLYCVLFFNLSFFLFS